MLNIAEIYQINIMEATELTEAKGETLEPVSRYNILISMLSNFIYFDHEKNRDWPFMYFVNRI